MTTAPDPSVLPSSTDVVRVWIWTSAEVVALDSFAVGDVVEWSCRDDTDVEVELPLDVSRHTLLIEDADYMTGHDDVFVEVTGRVVTIRVAHDRWHEDEERSWVATPGTRTWSGAERTHAESQVPPLGGASGYLVEVAVG
ncbi:MULTISPECIES: DUF6578 domain-containing protein [Aeromicrobium]|uniref:DUF6578 domain-containing protein n=1 Tax=Aeromicrobium TaxID=2040 RepID=UPI0007022733|nr:MULTISPECIES: DUF6578 domain-containing protein [Aeromicrobium]KQX76057.1 hypothetical protein ASD10_13265 [Aeromicrobium sp. Root472D3]MCL8250263.1 hypothetical protein [Aeromicrobium fastidiosum]